jgi:dTDP-4-dehydrorhamnose reductase
MTSRRLKILLTGRTGQLGWELERTLAPLGEVTAVDSAQLDLRDGAVIRRHLRDIRPDIIINAAAYTAVDKAEEEPDAAWAINAAAPAVLGEEARRLGALVIHYSTDYVFDGAKDAPYAETDVPNPLNIYGRSKLAGELALQETGAACIILRTSWVYGLRGKNFLLTMLRLAKEKRSLRVVDDQVGAPTWSRLVAEATAQMVAKHGSDLTGYGGLYHLTCQGETSWYGFAREIFALAPAFLGEAVDIRPITTDGYPTAAVRPLYSVLAGDKFRGTFGLALPHWREGLAMALK